MFVISSVHVGLSTISDFGLNIIITLSQNSLRPVVSQAYFRASPCQVHPYKSAITLVTAFILQVDRLFTIGYYSISRVKIKPMVSNSYQPIFLTSRVKSLRDISHPYVHIAFFGFAEALKRRSNVKNKLFGL